MPPHPSWITEFDIAFLFIINLLLFLLPGFSVATTLASRRTVTPVQATIITVIIGAVLGYLSFWCFLANKRLGKCFTLLLYALAIILVSRVLYLSAEARKLTKQIASPFLFVVLAGVGYLAMLHLFSGAQDREAGFVGIRFFDQVRPGDNLIPEIFADRIYAHQPLRPFCCGDWLSSDRPPLQAGIYLLVRPLRVSGSAALQYQTLTTALQCLWICGVWCVLVTLKTPTSRILQILVLLICSGFLFYNSVYVWPKLLAAGLILFVVSIVLHVIGSGRASTIDVILGTVSLGMAMLAHPGSVFSLSAFLLIFLARPHLMQVRKVSLAIVLLAALLLPWSAYQKFVDPPGNRLLKMHLAGVIDLDKRSFGQALRDSYTRHSLFQILQFKYRNIQTLFGPMPLDDLGLTAIRTSPSIHLDRAVTEQSRIVQREYIWNAIGWLNLGWIVLLVSFASGRRMFVPLVPYAEWLIAAALINLLVWCLIDFGPGGTFTTHSSYADILLLEIGLFGWILALPAAALLLLFVLQLFNLLAVWAFATPSILLAQGTIFQEPFLVLFLLCACCLSGIFVWSLFRGTRALKRAASDVG